MWFRIVSEVINACERLFMCENVFVYVRMYVCACVYAY